MGKSDDPDLLRFPSGPPPNPEPGDYDIARLLTFEGASTRQSSPLEDGISLADLRDTDENERRVERLLSAEGIPFFLERSREPCPGVNARITINVEKSHYRDTAAILILASQQGELEVVEGLDGLVSY